MPIAVTCPACQKRFSAPDALSGKRAKCSACGGVLVVPAPAPQPRPQPAGPKPTGQPRPQVAVVKPVLQPGAQVVSVKPVGQARPQVAVARPAPQPRSQPAGGNSLLDLLEQADLSAPQGQGAFGAPGGALPSGRATLGRPATRKSIWTSPVTIGLAVTGLVVIVGGGIAAAVLMAPVDDESASAPRVAAAGPQSAWPAASSSVGAPAVSSTTGQAAAYTPPATAAPLSEYERGAREAVVMMRQLADQMASIVDRPSAEAVVPKLIENANKLVALGNKLQDMSRRRQLTAHDMQVDREVTPEINLLAARINGEKPRVQALLAQLQMEEHFTRIAQVGMGASPGPQQQPAQQQQFVQPQPQFVQPQPPMMNPQPIGGAMQHGAMQHGPRQHGIPRH